MEQHRITCRSIFAHYIISGRNRAFDSFVGFGQWGVGFGPRKPALVQLWFEQKKFLKKHACLRTIELLCSLNIEGDTYSLVTPQAKLLGASGPPVPPPEIYAYGKICSLLRIFDSGLAVSASATVV